MLDTLIFDAKKAYRLREPIYWSVVPLSYFAFALLNGLVLKLPIPGAKDSPFAYFFINVNKFGPEILAMADLVTDDVEADGLYKAFDKLGLLQ